jgi:hypothetical protein
MKITTQQLGLVNFVLQIDKEGKSKQFPLAELTLASDIFKEIKKCTEKKMEGEKEIEIFVDGEVDITSEQKVFITKLIDERDWTVQDSEAVFTLKALLK